MGIHKSDLLNLIRNRLDNIVNCNSQQAQLLCELIPGGCSFAKDIRFFNYAIAHIPLLYKLNSFYKQLMELRFRA